jgi:Transmembrane secretion effector
MAAGSILWGAVAQYVGVPMSLVGSAAGLVLGLTTTSRFSLKGTEKIDVRPATAWPAPSLGYTPSEDAPALITVEYRIDPANAAKFKKAMKALRSERLRDGAIRWDLFCEADKPERYLELFLVESWIEHLRQHKRVTLSSQRINERASSFHIGAQPPVVRHFIGAEPSDSEWRNSQVFISSPIATDPKHNPEFYVSLLGLRLVKRTMNFDDILPVEAAGRLSFS